MTTLFPQERLTEALVATRQQVEAAGPALRVSGVLDLHGFRRLSDAVNLQNGSVLLYDVVLLNKRGMPTADRFGRLSIDLVEVSFVAQRTVPPLPTAAGDAYVEKVPCRVAAITLGHVVEGTISLYPGVDAMAFLLATDPPFLPMRDARVRWLSDRRLKSRYEFLLLNRARVIAASVVTP